MQTMKNKRINHIELHGKVYIQGSKLSVHVVCLADLI